MFYCVLIITYDHGSQRGEGLVPPVYRETSYAVTNNLEFGAFTLVFYTFCEFFVPKYYLSFMFQL